MIDLYNMQDYNARALSDLHIELLQKEILFSNNSFTPNIVTKQNYLKVVKVSIIIRGNNLEETLTNTSRLIKNIQDSELIRVADNRFIKGKFNAQRKHKAHNHTYEVIELNGLGEEVSDIKEFTVKDKVIKIVNKGTIETPAEIIAITDLEVTGLTGSTMRLKADDYIKLNGAIKDSIGGLEEFPKLSMGVNAVKIKGEAVLRFRERFI